ncbi:MAG: ComEC/Rec2 family competence protein [Phenylobacterium sp.]|uniref:ComEC/Rec2 family competence protein n=1 Tax=Phenylobacterium sp. TaxID=1871053 RepID=UPI00271D05B1|nr:ComEC/Rec2 family competence protein [Phenylobacterium sp.]MDO8901587.1 ComEC/Rec2 family competence protein [Phenylobacterium sp.]
MADQVDRWSLWTPVAFGLGCAAYFTLDREPLSLVAKGLLVLAIVLLVAARRLNLSRAGALVLVLTAFALAGFSTAKFRTQAVSGPVAPALAGPVQAAGWVVDVANPGQGGGSRVVIAPTHIEGLPAEATPSRLRVTLRATSPPEPGTAVQVLALINPPPPPASPGGYDFARDAYFESIGGVGFALRPPEVVELPAPPGRLALEMRINAARWTLAKKIVASMGEETGGLAAAMVIGNQAFIPREQIEHMRASGLAHLIAISGLHMAIVGGFVFTAVRAGVAAWPWLALRVSSKKVAALAGLAAVGCYLVVSGAPAPAERAAITASVAFAAVIFDRRAISLHGLALAALIVMLIHPEAVTEPGFQMSFSATAALVALAEVWPRAIREISAPWPIRLAQTAMTWLAASLAASFVAGMATGPFALQHFNRMATYGLAANLAASPISSFLMMPSLAVGAALTPLGLGDIPLMVSGWGIGAIASVAKFAAEAPGANLLIPSAPAWALPSAFLGILWMCLWRGAIRWIGLPFALAVSLAPRPDPPVLWVAADGAQVAVRQGEQAVLLRPDVKRFGAERWAQRHGLGATPDAGPRDALYDCDRWTCRPGENSPAPVAAYWSRKAPDADTLAALCASAELIVIRPSLPAHACPGKIILSGSDFERGGSVELRRSRDGVWRAQWAQDLRGRRPWSWGPSGNVE